MADHFTLSVQYWHVDFVPVTGTVAARPLRRMSRAASAGRRASDAESGARERLHLVANDSTYIEAQRLFRTREERPATVVSDHGKRVRTDLFTRPREAWSWQRRAMPQSLTQLRRTSRASRATFPPVAEAHPVYRSQRGIHVSSADVDRAG